MFRHLKTLLTAVLVAATVVVPVSPSSPASAAPAFSLPTGHLTITVDDLKYILDQIKIGQAHALRTATPLASLRPAGITTPQIVYPYDVTSADRCLIAADIQAAATPAFGSTGLTNIYPYLNTEMWGLRQVDGQCNNITNVLPQTAPVAVVRATSPAAPDTSTWGAADEVFPRLAPSALNGTSPYVTTPTQNVYQTPTNFIKDPTPRIISNIISDQSSDNPAAVAASDTANLTLYGTTTTYENSINATTGAVRRVAQIPNVTPDFNASAGYNSWFTLFGQFYDHGLDLIPKNGASVFIPLQQSDPLYVQGAPNYMVLTRGADATGESVNTTTPYVDQSQTYGSHASQNFFLREYTFAPTTGIPTPTGRLIDGTDTDYTTLPPAWLANRTVGGTLTKATGGADISNGGLATWKEIKAQALLLGINLTDYDVNSIPVIATNQYGAFIPGPTGMPMVLFTNGSSYAWVSGTARTPISTGAIGGGTSLPGLSGSNWVAVSSGHVFLNDTMATAVPYDRNGAPLTPDADSIMNSPMSMAPGYYDNESLDSHYIAGDGRVNENIGLSAVHHVFHSEHNTVAADIASILANSPDVTAAFRNEWNGERIYQAARFVNEMEYQHMVFDEFIRRISPSLPVFLGYDPTIKADITAEFASAVYRLGHSMLNETIARSNPGTFYSATSNQDVSLLTGFTNPAQARLASPATVASAIKVGSTVVYTLASGEAVPAVGSIVSVSGLSNNALNLANVVVDSRTANSFTVSTRYAGGASSIATPISGGNDSSTSTVAPDGALVATVSVNDPGNNPYDYTPGQSAAAIAQGMSTQRGNEIDEFVTDAVRNNLLGLPLDLASLNITRGRDVGIPTLNQFRTHFAASLTPYTSWNDFLANLRHPESAVNFLAAYGTHPSITEPAQVTTITSASAVSAGAGNITITYNVPSTTGIAVGSVVSTSGLTRYNVTNAVVSAVTASSFTVSTAWTHSPTEPTAFASAAALRADGPVAIAGIVGAATPTSGSGSVTAEPTVAQRRARAQAILDLTVPDAFDFLQSSGAWTDVETGFNNIDLWLGGLAESPAMQPVTPPLLGTTFQFVFEDQSLKLQDGDRFYYLGRIAGTNLGEEIPAQKLTDIVRRNTPSANASRSVAASSGILGMNSPGFGIADCAWSNTASFIPASAACPLGSTNYNALGVLIHKGLDNTTGFADPYSTTPAKLTGGAGDDSIFGGAGNDLLDGGIGGDLIDGADGNDRILGRGGEDLSRGGPGDDVINAGESQAGDIADGNSGNDWLHCGNCTGVIASFIGETGNDFIQGGKSADLLLQGGEGSDWIEGLAGVDWLEGDSGLLGGGASPALHGGDDVLTGGAGIDIIFSDAGDDIVNAGDSADAIDSSYGFDWVNYQGNKRLDNGGTKPGVYLDLSGVKPNPRNNNGDAVLDTEAIAGSPGPDFLIGGMGADVTVPNVTGLAGATTLVLAGAWPQIIGGMVARGNGIGANATVVGPGAINVLNGVTTTTIDLTIENTAAVTGPVAFTTYPLTNPGLITGLSALLSKTRGWTKYSAVDPAATKWTGGTLLFGGAGNDQLAPMDGENVLDGAASLRTCLTVTKGGLPYTTGSDTACAGGRGYTSMSLLSAAMDAGTISPTDVTVVREIVRNSAAVTSVTTTGTTATYTAVGHNLTVGDYVSVVGAAPAAFSINNVLVTAVTATTFTVASTAPAGTKALTAGIAKATDTLVLPNAEDYYTVLPMTNLPAGVATGFTVTGPLGYIDTVFDVEMVSYAGLAAQPLTATGSALSSLTVAGGTWSAPFTPGQFDYTVTVPAAATTVNVSAVAANLGTALTLQGTAQRSGEARSITLAAGPTLVTFVATAPDGVTTSTYTVTVLKQTPPVALSTWTTNPTGFVFSVTNYSGLWTYTCTTTAGTCTMGALSFTSRQYTISGLTTGAVATVTLTATRTGYQTMSATVTGSAGALAARVTTVGAATATADGFTFNVTNYSNLFTYTPTTTAGTVTVGTPVGSNLPITVTGLLPSQLATVTLNTTKDGYLTHTATVAGQATVAALTPALTVTDRSLTGYTVTMNNWVAGYAYSCTVTAGTCVLGTGSGTSMTATVSRLTAGQASTLTIGTTRTGAAAGTASISTGALSVGLITTFAPVVRLGTTLTVTITNYDPAYAYNVTASRGVVTKALPTGLSLVITVTNSSPSATVTVATLRKGYSNGIATITG